jgi:ParB family transcriptional regulator, chromosome partitioning protein
MIERKLGRGLDFLIGDGQDAPEEEIRQVETDAIRPNPFQPRHEFDPEALRELEESIRLNGILQPILLRQVDGEFEIVAGERRWRAACSLGLESIPAMVKTVEDERMLELALVENIQREDLNPMERAQAYRKYVETLGLTQLKASERLGKDRSTIANTMRLLDLPEEVQLLVSRGTLSAGHARALLGLEDAEARIALARRAAEDGLSVRAVESIVRQAGSTSPSASPSQPAAPSAHFADLEGRLRERLGTRVKIQDRGGRGKLVVEYYSREDFDRILEILEG